MKNFILRAAIGMSILLSLTGCEEYEGVDYLNIGHPADPASATGKRARMSRALMPETINVTPEFGSLGSFTPKARGNKPVMDHSKMNHGGH